MKFIKNILIIFYISFFCLANISLHGENLNFRKYQILVNMCKSMADIPCELKNYSYLYEYADNNKKQEIIKEVERIIPKINDSNYYDINFKQFKKNYIYFIVKLAELNFSNNSSIVKNVLKEADSENLQYRLQQYIERNYKRKFQDKNNEYFLNSKIKIGLILPLSGNYKEIGEKFLEGILTGINFFTKKNKTKIFLYDENKINNNINAAMNFFNKNNVSILIGPINNKEQDNAVEIAKQLNIPIISLAISRKTYNYPYYFNHSLNLKDEMKQLADYIKLENLNLGILYPESNFGKALKFDFISYYGVPEIILSYPPDAYDFRSEIITLGNLRKKSPKSNEYIQQRDIDAVFIADDIDKALLILPQLYFYDMKAIRIFGTNFWNSKKIFTLEKKYLRDITFLGLIDYNSNNETFLKVKRYLKKYFQDSPGYMNIIAYDTIKIIKKCQNDNMDFNNCMRNREGFFLLTGKTFFDNRGISHKKFKIFRILNGKINIY